MRVQFFGEIDQSDELDARRDAEGVFKTAPFRAYPDLILYARYERVREGGVIVSQAVLVAGAVDGEGRRQILAVELANRGRGSRWRDFLAGLRKRGLVLRRVRSV